jgi:hypothetical protein
MTEPPGARQARVVLTAGPVEVRLPDESLTPGHVLLRTVGSDPGRLWHLQEKELDAFEAVADVVHTYLHYALGPTVLIDVPGAACQLVPLGSDTEIVQDLLTGSGSARTISSLRDLLGLEPGPDAGWWESPGGDRFFLAEGASTLAAVLSSRLRRLERPRSVTNGERTEALFRRTA